MTTRHKVFISYHHENDEGYKNQFERMFGDIYISKSVDLGEIDPNLKTETIRQKIRDEFLRDSSVTVVLLGRETWKRKHIDWEISSSIRDTKFNPRSGLLGILLPTYPGYRRNEYNPNTIPPRLYDNLECKFAKIYNWIENKNKVQNWINDAFMRKDRILPNNSRDLFRNNRSGDRWY